jgi:hypothetical protein
MIPEGEAYTDLDFIDPTNSAMVEYWAEQWSVSSWVILAAIAKVGPLLEDVAPEIWSRRGNEQQESGSE